MAAGDRVQIGKLFKVGFGNFVKAGYQPTSVTNSRTADVETIRGTRNEAVTHMITNRGDSLVLNLFIEDAGSITPPSVGALISVTPPDKTHPEKYILASPPTTPHGVGITTMTLNLIKEDSMEATYNTSATLNVTAVNYDLSDETLSSTLTITFNDASAIISIVDENLTTLTPTTHWSVSGTTLTIAPAYLNTVLTNPGDDVVVTINFNVANSVTLTITAIA